MAVVDWGGTSFEIPSHACLYYSSEEELRTTLGFLRDGLSDPDTACVIFADATRFDALLEWLQAGTDVDVAEVRSRGRLVCIGGASTLPELVAGITTRLDGIVGARFRTIRFLGFIGWGDPGWPGERDLLEFESRVNDVIRSYPAVVLCTYGVPRLSGEQLLRGGLQTHRVVRIGDTVIDPNPFYVEPSVFVPGLASAPEA